MSKSFGSLLQSGFSLLGVQGHRQHQAHPANHDFLVIFVVGGMSCAEARAVSAHAAASLAGARGPRALLIGSTHVTSSHVLTRQLTTGLEAFVPGSVSSRHHSRRNDDVEMLRSRQDSETHHHD